MAEIKKTGTTVRKTNPDNKKIEELEKKLAALAEMLNQQVSDPSKTNKSFIDPDKDIEVISLCNGTLNLSTEGYGHGEVYTFTDFGEVQMIPFHDLKNIVRHQKSFLKSGFFLVDNSDALVAMSVSKICENIPDKDVLLNLFDKDPKTIVKVFEMMPEGQRNMFAGIMVNKLYKEETIDTNVVMQCGSIVGRDLFAEAKNKKELQSGGE
jgi:hypothetical protein